MTACRWTSSTTPRVLVGRHDTGCDGDDCAGCLPCMERHCVICSRVHVEAGACPECIAATRDDLREIATLCDALPTETVHRGVNSEAAMLWGPTADPEAWRNRAMSAMMGRADTMSRDVYRVLDETYLEDCRDEAHPLFVLGTWEQVYRDVLDQPTDLKVTLPRLVDWLDRQLHRVAAMEEPPFEDFARDLRACRAHLEDVLTDGERDERTRVPCIDCGVLLVKVYGKDIDDDRHVCARCRRRYTVAEFALAKADHLASEDAERFVLISDALSAIERPEQTLRTWMRAGKVAYERDESGRMMVWWPDVREMHLSTPRRNRGANGAACG